MKRLRQFFVAVVLTLALTLPALAGDMGFPVTSPTPQPTSVTVVDTDETENSATDVTSSDESTAVDSTIEIMLDLWQSLLTIF